MKQRSEEVRLHPLVCWQPRASLFASMISLHSKFHQRSLTTTTPHHVDLAHNVFSVAQASQRLVTHSVPRRFVAQRPGFSSWVSVTEGVISGPIGHVYYAIKRLRLISLHDKQIQVERSR